MVAEVIDAPAATQMDHALALARRGLCVFPLMWLAEPGRCHCGCADPACWTRGKHPLLTGWERVATADWATITGWWRQWPRANVGIACAPSGIVAIDFDQHTADADGIAERRRLEGELGLLPETWTTLTGGGGEHYLFTAPEGVKIHNSAGKLASGIDVRGVGGYVVAPGSLHPSGRIYQWDAAFNPDICPLADLPEAWAAAMLGSQQTRAATPAVTAVDGVISEGQRNATLASRAGMMRRVGMSEAVIEAALIVVNAEQCVPPLGKDEVRQIAHSIGRYPPAANFAVLPTPAEVPPLTELANARQFADRHREDVRWCAPLGGWLRWTGTRWEPDALGVERLAVETVYAMYEHLKAADLPRDERDKIKRHIDRSATARGIKGTLDLVKSEPGLAVGPEVFDRDPLLLGCPNGTLDLRTGILRPAQREDLITKVTAAPYEPHAAAPVFMAFVTRAMGGDLEKIDYLQRFLGYCLTGDTGEEVIAIGHGSGANGKTKLVEALLAALGDYGATTPFDAITKDGNKAIRNDLAALRGARFVAASEPDEGCRLDEATVKRISGGDTITVRLLYKEFFSYRPSYKVFLTTNHLPRVKGSDEGIWRRLHLIPFDVTIPEAERDRNLLAKLHAELAGILAWLVEGCRAWQAQGLAAPAAVNEATTGYRTAEDVIGRFLGECTETGDTRAVQASVLHGRYTAWCATEGEEPKTPNAFGRALSARGLTRDRVGREKVHTWVGVGLTT